MDLEKPPFKSQLYIVIPVILKPPFNGVNPFHLNGTSIFGNLHLNPSYTEWRCTPLHAPKSHCAPATSGTDADVAGPTSARLQPFPQKNMVLRMIVAMAPPIMHVNTTR